MYRGEEFNLYQGQAIKRQALCYTQQYAVQTMLLMSLEAKISHQFLIPLSKIMVMGYTALVAIQPSRCLSRIPASLGIAQVFG